MIDRKQAPHFSSDFTFTLLSPEKSIASNGAHIFWIRNVQQDVVKIELVFRAGKWYEPKNGVAFFTAALIDKGTKKRNSKSIADYLDQLGAQLECSAGLDYLSISVYSLNRTLTKALTLLAELLTESVFPADELELVKSIQIQNLKINNEKNNYVASKLIRKNIFGTDHPYGRSLEEVAIAELNQSDLSDFYNRISPHQVYITGNISNQDYKEALKCIELISKKELGSSRRILNPLNENEAKTKAGSIQTSIRLGKIFIKNSDPDYPDALVLNHILGGYFGSRLMKNIREDKGLTYGIYSSISTFSHHGFFSIGAEVNKENTQLTIDEIANEINILRSVAVTQQELDIVKNHLLGSLQLELANPFSVTEKIKNINLNNLPEDYYTSILRRVLKINSDDILRMANQHFNPQTLFKVTVG